VKSHFKFKRSKMSKIKNCLFLAAILITTQMSASGVSLTTTDIRSAVMTKNHLGIRFSYNRINDTIDIFDIKQKELGSTANFGSIGDSSGLDLSLAYGVNEYFSAFYNFEYLRLHYIDNMLKNKKNEIFAKINIYHNPMSFFEDLSADIGYVRNSASDLDIKSSSQLNSMIQKVNPIDGLTIEGSVMSYKNKKLSVRDDITNEPISPFIRIGDMSDNSFYLRFLTGFNYETNIFDIYAGLKYTSINTTVSIQPKKNASTLQDILKNAGYSDVVLDRSEKSAFFGFNYTVEFSNFIFDANYEYLTIWGRDNEIEKTEDNHIIKSALSYIVNKELLIYLGGKLMINQFNGVIPYLYNKYTKNKYDKKYGYAKVGFVYNFDTTKYFTPLLTIGY